MHRLSSPDKGAAETPAYITNILSCAILNTLLDKHSKQKVKLFRPHDVRRQDLCSASVLLFIYLFIYLFIFTLTLSPLRPSRSVRQNYTYAELLRSTLSYILEGSDSCSRRLNFRHLASSCFKSEELVGNLILPLSATMIELCFDSDTSPTSTLFQFLHGVKYVENWPNFGP